MTPNLLKPIFLNTKNCGGDKSLQESKSCDYCFHWGVHEWTDNRKAVRADKLMYDTCSNIMIEKIEVDFRGLDVEARNDEFEESTIKLHHICGSSKFKFLLIIILFEKKISFFSSTWLFLCCIWTSEHGRCLEWRER